MFLYIINYFVSHESTKFTDVFATDVGSDEGVVFIHHTSSSPAISLLIVWGIYSHEWSVVETLMTKPALKKTLEIFSPCEYELSVLSPIEQTTNEALKFHFGEATMICAIVLCSSFINSIACSLFLSPSGAFPSKLVHAVISHCRSLHSYCISLVLYAVLNFASCFITGWIKAGQWWCHCKVSLII